MTMPMIGQTIGYIAEAIGMEIRATTSASDFFDALDRWQPGRIVLDLIMPDMDGVEVLVELARRDCRAHIIITSGVGSRVLDAARTLGRRTRPEYSWRAVQTLFPDQAARTAVA
jgi:DNA-binding response OmpR family regulator